MRKFEEIIKHIKFSETTLVPIYFIAGKATNYPYEFIAENSNFWINENYDHAAKLLLKTNMFEDSEIEHKVLITVWRNFDVWVSHEINGRSTKKIPSNQVDIFNFLKALKFI